MSPQSLLLHGHYAPSRITTRTVIESVKSKREKRGEQWNDHVPVQQQVAQICANSRPTICREKPEPRAKIIAVAAHILNLERFRIGSRILALMRELSDNTC